MEILHRMLSFDELAHEKRGFPFGNPRFFFAARSTQLDAILSVRRAN